MLEDHITALSKREKELEELIGELEGKLEAASERSKKLSDALSPFLKQSRSQASQSVTYNGIDSVKLTDAGNPQGGERKAQIYTLLLKAEKNGHIDTGRCRELIQGWPKADPAPPKMQAVHSYLSRMSKEGYVKNTDEQGIWKLMKAGREELENNCQKG